MAIITGTWSGSREAPARYGAPIEVKPRLGQGLFSLAVRDAYRGACAVTGEHSGPVLKAAHIIPYARGGEHRVDNGTLLQQRAQLLLTQRFEDCTPINHHAQAIS